MVIEPCFFQIVHGLSPGGLSLRGGAVVERSKASSMGASGIPFVERPLKLMMVKSLSQNPYGISWNVDG